MVRLLKALGLAVPLFLIAVFILARFSEYTRENAAGVLVRAAQFRQFLGMAPAKDRHCSLADVWKLGIDFDSVEARRRLERSFQHVKSDGGLALISTPHSQYWIPYR